MNPIHKTYKCGTLPLANCLLWNQRMKDGC